MGMIYSNAHLVISVDGASLCTEGFLPVAEHYTWMTVSRGSSGRTQDAEVVWHARELGALERQHRSQNSGNLRNEALSRRG
jgi:hypothetical protein